MTGAVLTAYVLFDILLIVVLARCLGNLVGRIGQPRVVGEILAGVLLGPTLLGEDLSLAIAPEPARPVIAAVAVLGLMLFMLVAALECDKNLVTGRGLQAGILALASVAVPAVVGFPVATMMHNPTFAGPGATDFLPFALFVGAALSVTAFPVMTHILMERGELNGPIGGLAVATTAIMSVLMFLYLTFAGLVAGADGVGSLVPKLLLVALFITGSWYWVRPAVERILRPACRHGTVSADGMSIVFCGLLLWGWIADRLGIHAMIGAFLWGLLLPGDREIRAIISARIKDTAMILFLPIFFAFSGFQTDLKLITPATALATALFLLAAVGSKFLAALPARGFDHTWNETTRLAALLNTRGFLVLVAGLVGLQLQLITVSMYTIIVLVALVTTLMTLPLLNALTRLEAGAVEWLVNPSESEARP